MNQEFLRAQSYTAAGGELPIKLIHQAREIIKEHRKRIIPYHIQLNPTNTCNLSCSFCSCSKRDRKLELPLEQADRIMSTYMVLGARSVTVTGGGEPLLHPRINEMMVLLHDDCQLSVGLVTNGTVFDRFTMFSKLTWCRISMSDEREFHADLIHRTVSENPSVDWSFSYVVGSRPNFEAIRRVVSFAEEHGFTHVRLVADLLCPDKVNLNNILVDLHKHSVSDRLVIYQPRNQWVRGSARCLISLLKPVVGADGAIYPCCGTQYADAMPSRDYHKRMQMATNDLGIMHIYQNQLHFDGSECARCYYDSYNKVLALMVADVEHKEFV